MVSTMGQSQQFNTSLMAMYPAICGALFTKVDSFIIMYGANLRQGAGRRGTFATHPRGYDMPVTIVKIVG